MFNRSIALVLVLAGPAFAARAGFSYTESVHGELSDNRLAPSSLAASFGSNVLSGTIGRSAVPDAPDLDYVTITIPVGMQLTHINLLQANVGGAVSFIGVQQGPQVTVPYTTSDASPLLGWHHFGGSEQGSDILQAIGAGPGAIGFAGPLGPGQYTFWIMELNTAAARPFSLEFVVVPAPSTTFLAAVGVAIASTRRRRGTV
jgi:hypothetical protein